MFRTKEKRKKMTALRILGALLITVVLCIANACGVEVRVRDMQEVVSRGSFVYCMGNNADKISDLKKTLVFDTYEAFCEDAISEAVLFSRNEYVNNKYTFVEYQAKNERYNSDYFEKNNLIVAFFETDLNAGEFIITDVAFADGVCTVSTAATLMKTEKLENKIPYACFIETADPVPADLTAKVEVVHTSLLASSTFHFSDAETASDVEKVGAYLIRSVDELAEYIADNTLLSETGSLRNVLNMRYTAEYFEEFALLLIQTPGKYYGYYYADGNSVCGIRLDSDHYDTIRFEDDVLPKTQKAAAVLLSVPLDFDYETLTYSFQSYFEWEEDVVAENTQSGKITLVRNDGEERYSTYVQQDA